MTGRSVSLQNKNSSSINDIEDILNNEVSYEYDDEDSFSLIPAFNPTDMQSKLSPD